MSMLFVIFALLLVANAQPPYPVPLTPGGRNAVHGWLILPIDQPTPTYPDTPVSAWFVHHTPEFWTDSPHNFQIILFGTMVPFQTANNVTEGIPIPYPPKSDMLVDEFTITPPGPFSLNDLLAYRIDTLYGVVYNGSFDTLYERYALSIATLNIVELTTAVYLNISSAIAAYPEQRYYSYPRTTDLESEDMHLYLSHQIHAAPDFDQVIHVLVETPSQACSCQGCASNMDLLNLISSSGAVWQFPNTNNTVSYRFMPGDSVSGITTNSTGFSASCKMQVLEEIHCVLGPAFADRC